MNLEDFMLSEVNQAQKNKCHIIFYVGSKTVYPIEVESRTVERL
jgi:hypothetical protein